MMEEEGKDINKKKQFDPISFFCSSLLCNLYHSYLAFNILWLTLTTPTTLCCSIVAVKKRLVVESTGIRLLFDCLDIPNSSFFYCLHSLC